MKQLSFIDAECLRWRSAGDFGFLWGNEHMIAVLSHGGDNGPEVFIQYDFSIRSTQWEHSK